MRDIKHRVLATAATCLLTSYIPAARADEALEPVTVSVSHVSVEALCGQTPTPDQPLPHCPTTGTLALTYLGGGCTAEDFVIKLRQRVKDQVLRVSKRAAATECIVDDSGGNGGFTTVTVAVPDIDISKPVRVANPLPLFVVLRP